MVSVGAAAVAVMVRLGARRRYEGSIPQAAAGGGWALTPWPPLHRRAIERGWIPAFAGNDGGGGGNDGVVEGRSGLDCGLRRNDGGTSAIYRAATRKTYPCQG